MWKYVKGLDLGRGEKTSYWLKQGIYSPHVQILLFLLILAFNGSRSPVMGEEGAEPTTLILILEVAQKVSISQLRQRVAPLHRVTEWYGISTYAILVTDAEPFWPRWPNCGTKFAITWGSLSYSSISVTMWMRDILDSNQDDMMHIN